MNPKKGNPIMVYAGLLLNPKTGSSIMIVAGLLSMLCGLANIFGRVDGVMIIAGAILMAGGMLSASVVQLAQHNAATKEN